MNMNIDNVNFGSTEKLDPVFDRRELAPSFLINQKLNMTSFHEDAKYRTEVDKSCDEACLHAAYCGRGDPHSQTTDPNGGATNFGAVLNYLTHCPVDHVPLAERGVLFPGNSYAMACHLMTDNGSHVTLLRASLCSEWGGFENQSKRMMLELVLLAGADTNDPDLEEFFGLSFFSGGGQ